MDDVPVRALTSASAGRGGEGKESHSKFSCACLAPVGTLRARFRLRASNSHVQNSAATFAVRGWANAEIRLMLMKPNHEPALFQTWLVAASP